MGDTVAAKKERRLPRVCILSENELTMIARRAVASRPEKEVING
jgi:hypothetical protein